jgi:hypothetical protein
LRINEIVRVPASAAIWNRLSTNFAYPWRCCVVEIILTLPAEAESESGV